METDQTKKQNQPFDPNEPKTQTHEYISKATLSKLQQNQRKASSFIRNDIFLVRVKLPQAKWNIKNVYNQEIKKFKEMFVKQQEQKRMSKIKAMQEKNQDKSTSLISKIKGFVKKQSNESIRGNFKISFLSSSSFYYSQDEYRQKFPKKFKPKLKQEQKNSIEKIIENIGSSERKQPPPQYARTKSKILKPKQNQKSKPNTVSKIKKVKDQKINKYQIKKQVHHLQVDDPKNSSKKSDSIYQQIYEFEYRRNFPKQKIVQTQASFIDESKKASQNDKSKKKFQLEFSQYTSKLLEDNQCLTFSATKEDVVQISFKELLVGKIIKNLIEDGNGTKIKQDESASKVIQEEYAVAWAKFPLNKFLQNPYISHEITLNLYSKIQANNKQTKEPIQSYLRSCQLSLQIFCAPAESWGILQFRQVQIISEHSAITIGTYPLIVTIQIQFPDIQKLNQISRTQQPSCTNLKSLEIERNQRPIWMSEQVLNISSKHNRMKMRFIEIDGDTECEKELLGECEVDLVESGMVVDGVEGRRILGLTRVVEGKKQFVGDLIVQFSFTMNLKPKNSQDYLSSFSKTNSFVDATFNIT